MDTASVPFRLPVERLQAQLAQFQTRAEVQWFGFAAELCAPATVRILPRAPTAGQLGGGGTQALNGGVIAAGFDAAFVLAGLAQYDDPVVVTLELSVQYLSLARADRPLAFTAQVLRSSRRFCFVNGVLGPADNPVSAPCALATGLVAPAR